MKNVAISEVSIKNIIKSLKQIHSDLNNEREIDENLNYAFYSESILAIELIIDSLHLSIDNSK